MIAKYQKKRTVFGWLWFASYVLSVVLVLSFVRTNPQGIDPVIQWGLNVLTLLTLAFFTLACVNYVRAKGQPWQWGLVGLLTTLHWFVPGISVDVPLIALALWKGLPDLTVIQIPAELAVQGEHGRVGQGLPSFLNKDR